MAKAVVREAVNRNLVHEELHSKVEYIVAHGISSKIGEKHIVIGSYHFVFEDENATIPEGKKEIFEQLPEQYSHLYMAIDGVLVAVICIEDPLRPEAVEVIAKLKKLGISKVVMMTGDSDRVASAIAKKVGVDEYHSEVLPEDKASFVEAEKNAGRKVIMVGDGINDSPALSAADVGIAISDGAEIAREIADVTVGADDLHELVTLKKISNGLMERIHRNYRLIVGINTSLIVLGVAGAFPPTTSALLHNTSTLLISLKSMNNLLDEKEEVTEEKCSRSICIMETKLSDFHKIKRMRIRQEQNERIISWGSGNLGTISAAGIAACRTAGDAGMEFFGPKTCAPVEKVMGQRAESVR